MKTAISLPNDVFERAERLAHQQGRSRSELYAMAVREYVARHAADEVTEALDQVVGELRGERSEFRRAAVRRVAERTEW